MTAGGWESEATCYIGASVSSGQEAPSPRWWLWIGRHPHLAPLRAPVGVRAISQHLHAYQLELSTSGVWTGPEGKQQLLAPCQAAHGPEEPGSHERLALTLQPSPTCWVRVHAQSQVGRVPAKCVLWASDLVP